MKRIFLLACASSLFFASCGNKGKPVEEPDNDDPDVVVVDDDNTLYIRQNVYDMDADNPVITGYQRAITQMQSLPESDPTSWAFQAAIHGKMSSDNPDWNQCQHGSFFFISWHRMYLYYFERIVRKYSEESDWALPYWDYSNPRQRSMPALFRENTGDNPLYIPERRPSINAGAPLSPETVSLDCLTRIPFTGTPTSLESFGGQTIPAPQQFWRGTGALENVPHNVVHNAIGGWMGSPYTAAQDPVFWLHHANIDRLWNEWISMGGGRMNPDDEVWLNTEFAFFDENGNRVVLTGAEVVNTASQLDYRYDGDPEDLTAPVLAADDRRASKPQKVMTEGPQEGKVELARVAGETTAFTSEPLTLSVPMEAQNLDMMKNSFAPGKNSNKSTYLTVEGVSFDALPEVSIGVFINVPEGSTPDFSSAHFVSMITFFDLAHLAHHDHGNHGDHTGEDAGSNFIFGIEENLKKLEAEGIDISDVRVTFALTDGVEPLEDENALADPSGAPVGTPSFKSVSIQVF